MCAGVSKGFERCSYGKGGFPIPGLSDVSFGTCQRLPGSRAQRDEGLKVINKSETER